MELIPHDLFLCPYYKEPMKTTEQRRTCVQQLGSGLLLDRAIHIFMIFPYRIGKKSQNLVD